jgi:hypothetical protein
MPFGIKAETYTFYDLIVTDLRTENGLEFYPVFYHKVLPNFMELQ